MAIKIHSNVYNEERFFSNCLVYFLSLNSSGVFANEVFTEEVRFLMLSREIIQDYTDITLVCTVIR